MPATKRALAEWLPKAAAAELLGVRPRQLERREAQGFIESRREPRKPNESTSRVLYSRADILALKAGTPNVHARPERESGMNGAAPAAQVALQKRENGTIQGVRETPMKDFEAFARLYATIAKARETPPALERYMSVAEAVEYSGLPAAYLIKAAKEGTIRAVNVGTGKREFWRFAREGAGKP